MPNGHDKNFIRLCAAIEGFRVRYGKWPTNIRLFPGVLENLRSLFTQEDFAKLNSRVQLIPAEASIVAEDDEGNSYSYGGEGFPSRKSDISARTWLGVLPIPDDR
jgi:hypothetical protein